LARATDAEGAQAERKSTRDVLALDLTMTGGLVGTPIYMAPEQLDDADVTGAADQFAFAVALWEALCGELPFRAEGVGLAALASGREAMEAGRIAAPPAGRMPRAVEAGLRRALAAEPGARWPSMHVLVAALEHAIEPRRRGRVIVAAGAVA